MNQQQESGPLVSFLQSVAKDHDFHSRFMEAESYADFWEESDVQSRLDDHGWNRLSPDQQRLFREKRTLPRLQEAVEAELNGEDWPYDVSAHENPRKVIGPCWVLVRI